MSEIFEEELEIDTLQDRYLTFTLGEDIYGIAIKYVVEIIGIQSITAVPKVPHYIMGVINLRGKVIPVIDVRMKFGKESIEYNDRTCIIVIEIGDVTLGLIVDRVDEVLAAEDDDLAQPPANRSGFDNRYVMAIVRIGAKKQLLLDVEKLVKGDMPGLEDIEEIC